MTIAALRRLLDAELPDVVRHPAPRLRRRPLPSMERPMTATASVVLAMHRDGYSDQQIADQQHVSLGQVTAIIDAERDELDAQQPGRPEAPAPSSRHINALYDLAELRGWAVAHENPELREQGEQLHSAVSALQKRHDAEAELTRLAAEAAELEERLAELRARQAELQPKPKARKAKSYAAAEVRAWARQQGLPVPAAGRVPAAIVTAWQARSTDQHHAGEEPSR
jgi:hypothetical protein